MLPARQATQKRAVNSLASDVVEWKVTRNTEDLIKLAPCIRHDGSLPLPERIVGLSAFERLCRREPPGDCGLGLADSQFHA
jgi:hypothetical protein